MSEVINYKVYMHTVPNGKGYIGITMLELEGRWKKGKGYENQLFDRAIKKYGWENIKHTVLFSNLTKEQAKEKEIQLIKEHNCTNPKNGYNVTIGGEGSNGFSPSEETRRKISESHKGEKAVWFGRHLTDDMKRQISTKIKLLWKNKAYRGAMIASIVGRKLTEEHKGKISKGMLKIWEGNKGYRNRTLENLEIMRNDEEIQKRRINGIKRAYENEELRDQMSIRNAGGKNPFYGKHHTDETKRLLADLSRGKCGSLHPRSKPVLQYDMDGNFIGRYESGNLAAMAMGTTAGNINSCARGEKEISCGYKWKRE